MSISLSFFCRMSGEKGTGSNTYAGRSGPDTDLRIERMKGKTAIDTASEYCYNTF